jgi:MFS superfamily sulfate permease-like transporter
LAAGLFFYIPQAALGAIIITSVATMFDYEVRVGMASRPCSCAGLVAVGTA